MPSIIEFNGKKYDSLTGRILSGPTRPAEQIDAQRIFKPEPKSVDGITSPKKIEVTSESKPKKPALKSDVVRKPHSHHRKVEKSHTLIRSAVKKSKHRPAPEHKAPPRAGLYHELTRERAHRAKHIRKSPVVSKFSKTPAHTRSDIIFTAKPLPVAVQPAPVRVPAVQNKILSQAEQLVGKLEDAVQSAEAHLETYAEDRLKTKRSRKLAYALASFTSVLLIGFAVYQAIPFVQVKMAGNKAGFAAALPGYAPNGYELDKNLQSQSGEVALTYTSPAENKAYKITQTPSQWNSDSLLNNYVLPASAEYERLDQNGQTIYLYDGQKSATWLDSGIWYRLDGADNFSNDQLLRIVQGL